MMSPDEIKAIVDKLRPRYGQILKNLATQELFEALRSTFAQLRADLNIACCAIDDNHNQEFFDPKATAQEILKGSYLIVEKWLSDPRLGWDNKDDDR